MTDIDILFVDKWVSDNQIPEVKNGIIYTKKSANPDPEGLISYEIFGYPGTLERKQSWGQINLVNKFVHPHVLYELKRYKGSVYGSLMNGNEDFFVNSEGEMTQVTPSTPVPDGVQHGTGVRFLYKVWDKLIFDPKRTTSSMTAMRLKFLSSLSKSEVFMSHMPVIPAYFRDMSSDNDRIPELNTMYRKILNNSAALKTSSGVLELFGTTSSDRKIQDTITEIYQYFVDIVGGTKGFIHKNVMGKSTDYSARAVISMANFNSKTYKETEVSFEYSAIPLSTVCKCFAPFIKYGIKLLVDAVLMGRKSVWYLDPKTKELSREELANDFMDDFNSDNIDKLIQLYDSSYEFRLEPMYIRLKNKEIGKVPLYFFDNERNGVQLQEAVEESKTRSEYRYRPMTLTEAFYMAAYQTCNDKCMYITRYPIEDQHNIYPTKFNIIPCTSTEKRTVFGTEYSHWPILPDDRTNAKNLNYIFVDTIRVFPTYLKALGGDFDGDQISTQGVFTEEANEACRKYITSKMNIANVSGGTMREFAEVSAVGLYNLTYRFEK